MSGKECSVCQHSDAVVINEALILEGASNRATADRFGVSREAIRRHKKHIPELLLEARTNMEVYNAASILSRIEALERETLAQLEGAKDDGDRRVVLSAIREQRANLELVARISQLISDAPTINIVQNPQFLEIQAVIVGTLEEYPEAKRAVARALGGVDGG